jgi:hypothetical protein
MRLVTSEHKSEVDKFLKKHSSVKQEDIDHLSKKVFLQVVMRNLLITKEKSSSI